MKKIADLKNDLTRSLLDASIAYFRLGMSLFHEVDRSAHSSSNVANMQVVIGNLGTAIELLMKSLIAKRCPSHLFSDLSLELRLALAYPDAISEKSDTTTLRHKLRDSEFKTIELNDTVAIFSLIYPEFRNSYRSYLSDLSRFRNKSVHSILPSLETLHAERMAYLAINLFLCVSKEEKWLSPVGLADSKFLKRYDEARLERIKKKLDDAKKLARSIEHGGLSLSTSNTWEEFVHKCPVCNNDGTLSGITYLESSEDEEEGEEYRELYFVAEFFSCTECGLSLEDEVEFKFCGMESTHDRSYQLEAWLQEHKLLHLNVQTKQ